DYKGTREKMPDELSIQIERIRELVQAFNIPLLEVPGYEADDVLGTIARQAAEIGVPVHIITGDRDLLQLVDENTVVELPPGRYERTAKLFDEAAVEEKYGLKPEQIVDMKALTGDKSDNIPGVAGVGDKTAVSLLQQYGTLDNIYEHLDEVAGRFRNKLAEGRESAYLSQQLAQIITDAPLQLEVDRCVTQEYDARQVLRMFQALEFRSLTGRLAEAAEVVRTRPDEQQLTQAVAIRTPEELAELV